jgi:hypothetical protein
VRDGADEREDDDELSSAKNRRLQTWDAQVLDPLSTTSFSLWRKREIVSILSRRECAA